MKVKQKTFILEYFGGKSATEAAKIAGYSAKTAYSTANRLLKNVEVKAELTKLDEKATSAKVMSVLERKERLSEIARARMSDFVTAGRDGSWINIGLDGCESAALQSVKSSTEYDDKGEHPTIITDIKLHSPITAIAELNKMEGVYPPAQLDVTTQGDKIGNGHIDIPESAIRDAFVILAQSGISQN